MLRHLLRTDFPATTLLRLSAGMVCFSEGLRKSLLPASRTGWAMPPGSLSLLIERGGRSVGNHLSHPDQP